MKNSTTAYALALITIIGFIFLDKPYLFVSSALFASAFLIIEVIEDKDE